MPDGLRGMPRIDVPLSTIPPMGIPGLEALLGGSAGCSAAVPERSLRTWPTLAALVDSLEAGGPGVVLTMGKGGVGKTTIAAAVAVALADRGHTVHLSTTDPAAHVVATVNGVVPRLRISRIDPVEETARYTAEVLDDAGRELDAEGRALLEEDLRSPCTEEIAVFRAFADLVSSREDEFIVLDTAPTGHTLLLLDAAEAYHREVLRKLTGIPDSVRELLPRLRDSRFTRVILVTLAEATPVHEAARLQTDLQRAGIGTHAWVINQSFLAGPSRDPRLRAKATLETQYITEVETTLCDRLAVVPWTSEEPIGPDRLRRFVAATRHEELTHR
jgi:arsenite-transporting ATPase